VLAISILFFLSVCAMALLHDVVNEVVRAKRPRLADAFFSMGLLLNGASSVVGLLL